MCEFFVKADPIQYEQRARTLRIHGVLTSLRLENMVWDILAEMAEAEGRTTNALIVLFHDEILAHRGEVPNFASFLRVTCMRYLRRTAHEAHVAAERATAHLAAERATAHMAAERATARMSAEPVPGRLLPQVIDLGDLGDGEPPNTVANLSVLPRRRPTPVVGVAQQR